MFAIDTGILIWGVKKHVEPGQEEMTPRCTDLLRDLKQRGIVVMVPSVAAAEYIGPFPHDHQAEQWEELGRGFHISPFDARAAAIASDMYNKRYFKELMEKHEVTKHSLKADVMIVATAIAHGATAIYSHDKQFKAIAQGRIIVRDIPRLQKELFSRLDDG